MSNKNNGLDNIIFSETFTAAEELRKRGIYYITGSIEEGDLLEISQDILLKHLTPSWKDEIQLIINSPGGDTTEGWALIDLLQWIRMDVRTTGLGQCLSMGAHLLACGTKGKRSVTRNTSIMIHGAWIDHTEGNRHQLAAQMKDIEQEHKREVQFWQEHSKHKTALDIEKIFLAGTDKYMMPDEALRHGIIDYVINPKPYMNGKKKVKEEK